MKFIKLLVIGLFIQSSVGMELDPSKVLISVVENQAHQQIDEHGQSDYIDRLDTGLRNQTLFLSDIHKDLSNSTHNQVFMHNIDSIRKALYPSAFISTINNYVINTEAINHHITFLEQLVFFKTQLDYFTKQLLIKYMDIVFPKGNYRGIDPDNINELLKLFNNYLRALSLDDKEHLSFLRQLIAQGKPEFQKILNYALNHKATPLWISDNYSLIDKQFTARLKTIANNHQVKLLKEFIDVCNKGQFKKAEELMEKFYNNNTAAWCASWGRGGRKPLETILKLWYGKAISQEERLFTYLRHIFHDAQERLKKEIKEISPEIKIIYGQLEHVRSLNSSYQKNFTQGVTRALSDDPCSSLYKEWVNRCYDALIHKQDSLLLKLECNRAVTDIQQRLESQYMKIILDLDQKIRSGKTDFNYKKELSDVIDIWNAATSRPSRDESYLESAIENRTLSLENTELDIRSLDLLSDAKQEQIIDAARDELVSAIAQTTEPYNTNDSSEMRSAKFQQRYDLALEQFQKTTGHFQNPFAQKKLLPSLIDTITQQYITTYYSIPEIILERAIDNIDFLPEFAKNCVIELTDTLKPIENSSAIVDWYQTFTFDQKQDFWTQLFNETIQENTQLADITALDARYLDLQSIDQENKLIDTAKDELRAFISEIKGYKITDSDIIRDEKFQQRYDFALKTFQKTCQQLQEPHARDALFATLMDTLSFEYFRVYNTPPRMVLERIVHNLTYPSEFARKYFIGMTNTLRELPQIRQKLSQFFEVFSSLNSHQRQELFSHIFADAITGALLPVTLSQAIKGVTPQTIYRLSQGLSPILTRCVQSTTQYCKELVQRSPRITIPGLSRLTRFVRNKNEPLDYTQSFIQYQKLKEDLAIREFTSIIKVTKHGIKRLIERKFTPEEILDLVKEPTYNQIQNNVVEVFVKKVGENKYNFMALNRQTEELVTALRHISKKSIDNLGKNHGWSISWK